MRENNNLLLLYLLIDLLPPSLPSPCFSRARVCVGDPPRKKSKRGSDRSSRGQGTHLNTS
jgi:hypothetical protein